MSKLKQMREAKGLSQNQLSKMSGVHYRTLQYYEQGRLDISHCKIEKLISVALALDCDIEDIVDDEKVIELVKKYQEG